MITKILLSLYLVIGLMLFVTMLLYSLDGELGIIKNTYKESQDET